MIFSTGDLARLLSMLIVAAAFSAAAGAEPQPKPFASGDPKIGKAMTEKDCVGCHEQRFDGDAAKIYLRSDRKVHTPAQLMAQIGMCNTQLKKNYFPEEEEHVAAYLNLQYYKFKP
jgi:hypothetical protein